MGSSRRQVSLRCWVDGQQVHEHLAKQAEVLSTVLAADGSGEPCRRRPVICRCERYLAGARSGCRSGCGRLQDAFQEQERRPKRRARAGHVLGGQTCIRIHISVFGFTCHVQLTFQFWDWELDFWKNLELKKRSTSQFSAQKSFELSRAFRFFGTKM